MRAHDLHATAERWSRRYGPVFRFDIGRRRIVVVADGAEIQAILRDRPDGFRRMRDLSAVLGEMGITGVFSAEGDDWRRQRRLAVTGLNSNHLHRYFHVIRTTTERLRGRLREAAREGRGHDIGADLTSFTVDITSALAFGHDLNTLERRDNALAGHAETVFEAIGRRMSAPVPYWRWVRLPGDRAVDRSLAELRRAVGEFVERARADMAADPSLREHPENFLQSMLAAQEGDGTFTDDEIFGNTLTLLLAGEDTTAHTLAWTTWFLASRPDVQARLAREADAVLGDDLVPADPQTVARLTYADAVLRESTRLKPVTPCFFIEPLAATTIAGTRVPAGTRLILLTRHAALEASDEGRALLDFDPDRAAEDADGGHAGRAPLAFGAGPRFCPGHNLAFLEAKTALAMVARSFALAPDGAEDAAVAERFSLTMVPAGLRLRLRERDREPRA